MKNKSFYLRLISIGVILAALLTYNSITQTRLEAEEAVQTAGQVAAQQAAAQQAGNTGTGNNGAANSGSDATGTNATGANSESSGAASSNSAGFGAANSNAAGSNSAGSGTATSALKDGTYQGEAQGYGGPVTVSVTISGGRITNVTVLSHDMEDEAYYNMAAPLADKVVEAQSTAIDTVSGATFSSNGILGAVEDALKEAT